MVTATGEALADPAKPIIIPASNPDEVDYEAELAVAINSRATGVTANDA